MFSHQNLRASLLLLIAAAMIAGCAGATATPTRRAGALPKPDKLVIHNFAVTPGEVQLDAGIMATAMRDAEKRNPSDEEAQVGRLVSEKLAAALVTELWNQGIIAVRPGPGVNVTPTTGVVTGQFVTVDQGNQSERLWIGFGLGASKLETRIQFAQNGKLVAEAQTSTKASLMPGMAPSLGAGAAAGTLTAGGAAVSAGSKGLSETFLATVEADARRTAKEVAKRIKQAYVDRGWSAK